MRNSMLAMPGIEHGEGGGAYDLPVYLGGKGIVGGRDMESAENNEDK